MLKRKIIVENSLLNNPKLNEWISETLKSGKVPRGSGIACNITNDAYVFEPLDLKEINLFGEYKEGYTIISDNNKNYN